MASHFKVTSRYGKALLDLAVEKGALAEVKKDAQLVIDTCEAERDLILLFKNPIVLPQKKLSVVSKLFKSSISALSYKFIEVIVRKNRSHLIYEVMKRFDELYNVHEKIGKATLTMATEPTEGIKGRVTEIIEAASKKSIQLETEVDESLIGGFQILYEDRLIDASVASKLKDLEREFID